MKTVLIIIAFFVAFAIIKTFLKSIKYSQEQREILAEIRKENPNYDRELKEAVLQAEERLRRQELYRQAAAVRGSELELHFGYQDACNDDEYWHKELKPKIVKILKEE